MRDLQVFVLTVALITDVALLNADTYTYVEEGGKKVTIEAQSIGTGQGFQALERRDGQLQIVPSSAIVDRQQGEGPEPYDREQMAELLSRKFGEDLVRVHQQGNFVVALVLSDSIEKSAEPRAKAFLEKANRFMNRVDDKFLRYAKSRKFPLHDARFPMVLLIFESEDEFNEYTAEATGGSGLSAANVAGFYSPITNWLAVRMSSCDSFAVPLHEAIHQQMYNRVFNRLAPIPKWFDEGIATGFEGEGERISISPVKVNPRYAAQAQALSGRVDWKSVVENDGAFTADVLAGNAYTIAWCMHWHLANKHREAYEAYVHELAQRETLGKLDSAERVKKFDGAFSVSVPKLQAQFPNALKFAVRKQKIRFDKSSTDGNSSTNQGLGQAELKVVSLSSVRNGLNAKGTLKNMSPLRSMTFYVTVETAEGNYAEWLIPDLQPGRTMELKHQVLSKRFLPALRMRSGSYQVFIRSTPSGSRESQNWQSGQIPGPYLSR